MLIIVFAEYFLKKTQYHNYFYIFFGSFSFVSFRFLTISFTIGLLPRFSLPIHLFIFKPGTEKQKEVDPRENEIMGIIVEHLTPDQMQEIAITPNHPTVVKIANVLVT